jgi:hypothetical protein
MKRMAFPEEAKAFAEVADVGWTGPEVQVVHGSINFGGGQPSLNHDRAITIRVR